MGEEGGRKPRFLLAPLWLCVRLFAAFEAGGGRDGRSSMCNDEDDLYLIPWMEPSFVPLPSSLLMAV